MRITAIVLAAGQGLRFKSRLPKALARLNKKPILSYSLSVLSQNRRIKDIILVVNRRNRQNIVEQIRKFRFAKIKKIVQGGSRRQDSVYNGLRAVSADTELVLIHDAARPLIDAGSVSRVIAKACECGAVILGVPAKDTIKKVKILPQKKEYLVKETLRREELWQIQTPQVFRKDWLIKAYKRFKDIDVTDDAMLLELLGKKVRIVVGSYGNIKITTPEDLMIAEALLKKSRGRG